MGDLQASDFPGFFGPGRDGTVPGPALATDWDAAPPVELWRHPVGTAWSGFAVSGPFAVTQEQHDEAEMVVAYHVADGSVRRLRVPQRGADKAAAQDLLFAAAPGAPFEQIAAEFYLAKAEIAFARREMGIARAALGNLRGRVLSDEQRAMRRRIEARQAKPVDAAVTAHQCRTMAVG